MKSRKDKENRAALWLKWLALNQVSLRRHFERTNRQNSAHSIARRLDRHRKKVEDIEAATDLFDDLLHVQHFAAQDDDLVDLFVSIHGHHPSRRVRPGSEAVRPRPSILGSTRPSEAGTSSHGVGACIDREKTAWLAF